MMERPFAFLIHDRPEPFGELQAILKDLSVESVSIKSHEATGDLVAQHNPPLVFMDMSLQGNSWMKILNVVLKTEFPLNVIMVGPLPDIQLYVSVIERGAFSFVAPPFLLDDLNAVVHSALMDVRDRREARLRIASASVPPPTEIVSGAGRLMALRDHNG